MRKINRDKPILIIGNPVSGAKSKVDVQGQISKSLQSKGIAVGFYNSTGYMDAYFYVKDRMDFDQYSSIGILGGDGSIHEVINGML
jgi:diacylglycerol kinase family enzyme